MRYTNFIFVLPAGLLVSHAPRIFDNYDFLSAYVVFSVLLLFLFFEFSTTQMWIILEKIAKVNSYKKYRYQIDIVEVVRITVLSIIYFNLVFLPGPKRPIIGEFDVSVFTLYMISVFLLLNRVWNGYVTPSDDYVREQTIEKWSKDAEKIIRASKSPGIGSRLHAKIFLNSLPSMIYQAQKIILGWIFPLISGLIIIFLTMMFFLGDEHSAIFRDITYEYYVFIIIIVGTIQLLFKITQYIVLTQVVQDAAIPTPGTAENSG